MSELDNKFEHLEANFEYRFHEIEQTIDDLKGQTLDHMTILEDLKYIRYDVEHRMAQTEAQVAVLGQQVEYLTRIVEKMAGAPLALMP